MGKIEGEEFFAASRARFQHLCRERQENREVAVALSYPLNILSGTPRGEGRYHVVQGTVLDFPLIALQ